jgi:hypothetical protein
MACGSVCGPPNWKFVTARHREVLNIPLDPPGNGPDVTQIKKIRQYDSEIFLVGLLRNFAHRLRKLSTL